MALKKTFKTIYGVEADYWRLNALSFSKPDSTIFFTLSLFASQENATGGVAALESRQDNLHFILKTRIGKLISEKLVTHTQKQVMSFKTPRIVNHES